MASRAAVWSPVLVPHTVALPGASKMRHPTGASFARAERGGRGGTETEGLGGGGEPSSAAGGEAAEVARFREGVEARAHASPFAGGRGAPHPVDHRIPICGGPPAPL